MATNTTIPHTNPREVAGGSDPYFYGWRMVPRWDDKTTQTWEKVPLTEWDVLHPEEEDFIVNNDAHDRVVNYLRGVLEDCIRSRDNLRLLHDHRVLWANTRLGAHGPDLVVFADLNKPWNTHRGTFPVAEMGARPVLIIEVTSPSTRYIDLDNKVVDYYLAGVPLYVIVDLRETTDGQPYTRVMGYRSTPEGYTRIPDDTNGIWVEEFRIWIVAQGNNLLCLDEQRNVIPDLFEQRDTERAARLEAEAKILALEAELKRLRGDNQ
jgi:Uma2 family endonuclease